MRLKTAQQTSGSQRWQSFMSNIVKGPFGQPAEQTDELAVELSALMKKHSVNGYACCYVVDKSTHVSIETFAEDQWATAGRLIAACQTIINRLAAD